MMENEKGKGILRLDVGNGDFSEDVLYVEYSQGVDVLEGDTATVYGILGGSITYVSQANYNITVPYLEAVAIEKGNFITKNIVSLADQKKDSGSPNLKVVQSETPKIVPIPTPKASFVSPTSAQFGAKTEIVKDVYITVSKPEDYLEDNRFMQPTKGNKYISVYVSYDNKSQNPVSYNSAGFTAVDGSGGRYNTATASNSPDLDYGTINQNALAGGNVVFSVPASVFTEQFIVHYNHHSPQEAVVDFR